MDSQTEREAITEAIARLFAGRPIRSSGNLDIVTLAQEAGANATSSPTSTPTSGTPSTPNGPAETE